MVEKWSGWTGPSTNKFRMWISATYSGSTISVTYDVESQYAAHDTQTLTRSGSLTGTTSYYFDKNNGGRHRIGTWTRSGARGTSYTFTGKITGVYNGASPSVSVSLTMPDVPKAPGAPTLSSVSRSSVYVSVTAPGSNGSAINQYQVQKATNSAFTANASTHSSTSRGQTITGLSSYTTYYFRVRARNGIGWGGWSATKSVRTLAGVPNAPGRPVLSAITSDSITSTVSAPANNGAAIVEYEHDRATNSAFTANRSPWKNPNRSLKRTNLSRATRYYFRARARNSAGWGGWSATASERTKAEIPVLGYVPPATSITRNSATFTGFSIIDNGGESPTNLRIQYNTAATATGALINTRGRWAAIQLTGLAADTKYYYRASMANTAGWSDWTAWQNFTTLDDAPDDIAPPTFTNVTETGMRFSWLIPAMNGASFQSFQAQVSLTDTFTSLIRDVNTTTVQSVDLSGLTPGTNYYVRVRVLASPNNGGWGVAMQRTLGVAPESGLRVYAGINGVIKQGELYTFVNGSRRKVRPMYQHDGILETE